VRRDWRCATSLLDTGGYANVRRLGVDASGWLLLAVAIEQGEVLLMARQSVRCSLCKLRFMTEISDMATAAKHAEACEKFRTRLAQRVEYRTRAAATCTYEFAKDPKNILDDEMYQMRALYLRFDRVTGHVNNAVPCDGRCYNARGHNCECQCGGKNHGAGNAADAGMVAA